MYKLSHNITEIGTFATPEAAMKAAEEHKLHDGHPIPWGREYKTVEDEVEVDATDEDGKLVKDKDGNRVKTKVKQGRMTDEIDEDVWVGGWWRIAKV